MAPGDVRAGTARRPGPAAAAFAASRRLSAGRGYTAGRLSRRGADDPYVGPVRGDGESVRHVPVAAAAPVPGAAPGGLQVAPACCRRTPDTPVRPVRRAGRIPDGGNAGV